jgi:hypothetical protein
MSVPRRAFLLFFSLSSLGTGLFVACSHPVAPLPAMLGFLGVCALLLRQPRLGPLLLPVFLPLLNFSPWTGWLIVDEFDLLVLAVVAAGYFRMHRDGLELKSKRAFFLLLAIVVLLAIRGASDLTAQDMNWFSDYTTPLNTIRVGKSLLWVTLLLPLVAESSKNASPNQVMTRFFSACLLGSCWVVLAVVWERAFYPGLLNVSTPYRTVAMFWEMHLGGAALDAYLVLIAPLLVWAWRARADLPSRLAFGAFILVYVYVCLTTFSRGVFGAIAGSVVLLGALLIWHRAGGKQARRGVRPSGIFMLVLVALEIALVLGANSFMSKRMAATGHDLGGRLQHWGRGIGLLKSPDQWLFGIGLGKLPTRLTQGENGLELPGAFDWYEDAGRGVMVLTGPGRNDHESGRLYALSRRVDLVSGQRYNFAMDVRSEHDVEMLIQVCAVHLLYPAACQTRQLRLSAGGWQRWEVKLSGYPFKNLFWQGAGHGVLSLAVLTAGTKIEVTNLHLFAGGSDLLRNVQFLEERSGWFPVARSYFLPWHIDNLYLELLIETGLVGLVGFLVAILPIVWRLFLASMQGNTLAPYYLSSLSGLLALGLVVSVFDMPRVATLFGLFLIWAWQCLVTELNVVRHDKDTVQTTASNQS